MTEENKKGINKKILLLVIAILLVLVVGITSTYAWFTWKSTDDTTLKLTIGELADVIISSNGQINTTSLSPAFNYTDGEKMTITFKNKVTQAVAVDLKLSITEIADELKNETLKYILLNGTNVISSGNFSKAIANADLNISQSMIITPGETTYTLYIYIDGNEENDPNMMGKALSGYLIVEQSTAPETAAMTISNLYYNASKTVVTSNSIEYNTAPSVSLMNDRLGGTTTSLDGGDIRYYGADPNNYIYFNCSDYSNQTSSTCELWRIIGVFDGKLKLIRNESIGDYSWDNKDTTTGAEDDFGKNDWSTARLMKLLNPSNYYIVDSNDNGLGQSLYYNSESGQCPSYQYNAMYDCDFTSTGIKNDTTKNMISEEVWNLGGHDANEVYPDQIYGYEKETTVYTGRPSSWKGKIALMYPSDYGYAVDLSKCVKQLASYNDSICKSNNWLFNGADQWALTSNHNDSSPSSAWSVYSDGHVAETDAVSFTLSIRPTLYLNKGKTFSSGDGSSSSPYQLNV